MVNKTVKIEQSSAVAANVVGQRLSLMVGKTECLGQVVAYFPKTQKHRIRFESEGGREKNLMLTDFSYSWLGSPSTVKLPSYELAVNHSAQGRRLQIYHQVRQRWYQATVLKYVEECQQHSIELEPQGKVHLVDLKQQMWRFTDLLGPVQTDRDIQSLATSRYMGVERSSASTWKAYYDSEDRYIGCFGDEKDAALAYDVYARKRGTPVNFQDRRICKAGIKHLRVPEPEEPAAEFAASGVPPEVISSSAPDAEEKSVATPDLASVATPDQASDATPDMESESSLEGDQPILSPAHPESVDSAKECSSSVVSNDEEDTEEQPVRRISIKDEDLPLAVEREAAQESSPEPVPDVPLSQPVVTPPTAKRRQRNKRSKSPCIFDSDSDCDSTATPKRITKRRPRSPCVLDSDDECDSTAPPVRKTKKAFKSVLNSDDEVDTKPSTKAKKHVQSAADSEDDCDSVATPKRKTKKHVKYVIESDDDDDSIAKPKRKAGRKKKKKKASKPKQKPQAPPAPLYAIGTRFIKVFDVGPFEGEIMSYNDGRYHVYYEADGDEENLSEDEFENYEILPPPARPQYKDDDDFSESEEEAEDPMDESYRETMDDSSYYEVTPPSSRKRNQKQKKDRGTNKKRKKSRSRY